MKFNHNESQKILTSWQIMSLFSTIHDCELKAEFYHEHKFIINLWKTIKEQLKNN
jgi:hypothetical protein